MGDHIPFLLPSLFLLTRFYSGRWKIFSKNKDDSVDPSPQAELKLGYLQYQPTPTLSPQLPKLRDTIVNASRFPPHEIFRDQDEGPDWSTRTDASSSQPDQSTVPKLGVMTDNEEADSPPHHQPITTRPGKTCESDQEPIVASGSGTCTAYDNDVNKELPNLPDGAASVFHGSTAPPSAAEDNTQAAGPEEELHGETMEQDDLISGLHHLVMAQEQTIQQMTAQLMELKMVDRHIIDDGELDGLWKSLVYKVSSFVSSQLTSLDPRHLHNHVQYPPMMRNLYDNPWKWIVKQDRGQLVCEALIWNHLLFCVFNQGSALWTHHDIATPMGQMRFRLQGKYILSIVPTQSSVMNSR